MKGLKKFVILTLALSLVVLSVALFAACDKDKDNDNCAHEWEVVSNSATCESDGLITSKCKICGKEKQEASAALGHDWDMDDPLQILTQPDCYNEGLAIYACTRCTQQQQFTLPKKHEYRPIKGEWSEPTCTKDGMHAQKCRKCGDESREVVPAKGHLFLGEMQIRDLPTCEEDGESVIECQRPDCDGDGVNTPAVQSTIIPALGHDWQENTKIDVEPTFSAAGSRSIHCNRCEKVKDTQTIPKLEEGKAIDYQLRVARANGEVIKIGQSGIKITVKNSQGVEVAKSNTANFSNGVMTVSLVPDTYTATIEGLPHGYKADTSYTINPGSVEKDLVVTASLLPLKEVDENTKYELGSVMHDYTFKDVRDGSTFTLSQLLQEKKAVLFNFFFTTCGACITEMPGLLNAYDLYKDDVAMIMLDLYPTDGEEKVNTDWIAAFDIPADIYVVQDITPTGKSDAYYNNICKKFGINSAPSNIVIDCEGTVVYNEKGATSDMKFRNIFKKYSSAPYYHETEGQSSAPQAGTSAEFEQPDVIISKKYED